MGKMNDLLARKKVEYDAQNPSPPERTRLKLVK
jgi:hypothetical protein